MITQSLTAPSLDAFSESIVQRLLRQKFASHTIIAVAHKLDTILDFDKVVVMKQGALVEYGKPHKLLEQQGSYFKSLYEDVSRTGGCGEGEAGDGEIRTVPR